MRVAKAEKINPLNINISYEMTLTFNNSWWKNILLLGSLRNKRITNQNTKNEIQISLRKTQKLLIIDDLQYYRSNLHLSRHEVKKKKNKKRIIYEIGCNKDSTLFLVKRSKLQCLKLQYLTDDIAWDIQCLAYRGRSGSLLTSFY